MSEGQVTETPLEEGQEPVPETPATETDPLAPLKEVGFDDPEKAAKSYKEAHATLTRQAQEIAELKKMVNQPRATGQAVTEDGFFEDPIANARRLAREEARNEIMQTQWELEADALREKVGTERFRELDEHMRAVVREKPHLNNNPRMMGQIFELAEEREKEEVKRQIEKFKKLGYVVPEGSETETERAEKLANLTPGGSVPVQTKPITDVDPTDTDAQIANAFKAITG